MAFARDIFMHASLSEIALIVQGVVVGDDSLIVKKLSTIDAVDERSLVFAEGSDNIKLAEASSAAVILVGKNVVSLSKPYIQVHNPTASFESLIRHFYPEIKPKLGVHASAVIADDVKLGDNVSIGPFVVIEPGSRIGDNCVIKSNVHIGHNVELGIDAVIYPQVTIYDNCRIGARVIIHASTVIGSDGFGYAYRDGRHVKMPHAGHVVIEDDVEIGANAVVDRATLGATVIGEGTKIDNLVQVAHSVKLGRHNILCAFTGIAGSSTSGDNVIFAANVGVSDHVSIGDNVILAARTGVPPKKHLKSDNVYLGSPVRQKDKAIEIEMSLARLPGLRKKILDLSKRIGLLESTFGENDKD